MRHFWINKQGKKIFIKDMSDQELLDAIDFLIATASDIKFKAVNKIEPEKNYKFIKYINEDLVRDLANVSDTEFANLIFPQKMLELKKELYERKIIDSYK